LEHVRLGALTQLPHREHVEGLLNRHPDILNPQQQEGDEAARRRRPHRPGLPKKHQRDGETPQQRHPRRVAGVREGDGCPQQLLRGAGHVEQRCDAIVDLDAHVVVHGRADANDRRDHLDGNEEGARLRGGEERHLVSVEQVVNAGGEGGRWQPLQLRDERVRCGRHVARQLGGAGLPAARGEGRCRRVGREVLNTDAGNVRDPIDHRGERPAGLVKPAERRVGAEGEQQADNTRHERHGRGREVGGKAGSARRLDGNALGGDYGAGGGEAAAELGKGEAEDVSHVARGAAVGAGGGRKRGGARLITGVHPAPRKQRSQPTSVVKVSSKT